MFLTFSGHMRITNSSSPSIMWFDYHHLLYFLYIQLSFLNHQKRSYNYQMIYPSQSDRGQISSYTLRWNLVPKLFTLTCGVYTLCFIVTNCSCFHHFSLWIMTVEWIFSHYFAKCNAQDLIWYIKIELGPKNPTWYHDVLFICLHLKFIHIKQNIKYININIPYA